MTASDPQRAQVAWLRRANHTVQRHGRIVAFALLVSVFGVGEVATEYGWVSQEDFPKPSSVLRTLAADLVTADCVDCPDVGTRVSLGAHTLTTIGRWASGFAAAAVIGILLGLALGRSHAGYAVGAPASDFLRALPSAAVWPVCVAVIGFKWKSQFLIILFGTVWPVLLNTTAAIRALPREATEALAFMRLRFLRRQLTTLRWAAPGVLTGLELGCSVAFLLAITVEVFYPSLGGIGWYISYHSQAQKEPPQAFAALFLAAAVGWLLNSLVHMVGTGVANASLTADGVREGLTRLALRFAPRSLRSRIVLRLLRPHVKASRYFRILAEDYVTQEIHRMFGDNWRLEVDTNLGEPYMLPADLAALAGDHVRQRDVRILAGERGGAPEVVVFARSWLRMNLLPDAVRDALSVGEETIGTIIRRELPGRFECDNLWYREQTSEKLGFVFGTAGAMDAVQRCRAIRIDGQAAILIHEFVPVRGA